MKRNTLTTIVGLVLMVIFFGAASAPAHQATTSDLLLPYFEVDMTGSGVTTFFAVVNSSPDPVRARISVFTNWGLEVITSRIELDGEEVRTINLSDWILRGKVFDKTLTLEELEHCQAALTGQASPTDDMFYGTEVSYQKAVGFVTLHTEGLPRPDVLFGDYFIVDPSEDSAQGEVLINIDPAEECASLCERHALRFLLGGGFDEGTEVLIWTGLDGAPSWDAVFPEDEKTHGELLVYRQDGVLVDTRPVGLMPLEVLTLAELGLAADFGWIDLVTDAPSFMEVRHAAQNRFSVGLQTFCLPKHSGPPAGSAPEAEVRIEKSTNGFDADEPTGPVITVGDPVLWEDVVFNTGGTELTGVFVTDDQGVAVDCPRDELGIGESMVCTGSGTAVQGQYGNIGTVTAFGPEGERVEDSDPSHYFGKNDLDQGNRPAIDIEKATNGHDADTAPGPKIREGEAVTWTYVVTNTGKVRLTSVTVSDNRGVAVSCPKTELEPEEAMTCTGHGTAVRGQYSNVGTATGQGPGGIPVEDSDPSHYFGEDEQASIDIEKATNGHDADAAPGPTLTEGDAVTWTYVVTNTGDVTLSSVGVSDDQGVAVSCPRADLAPGESMTCTGNGTAIEGQYRNVGTATGRSPRGTTVDDSDPSHYYGEPEVVGFQGCTPGYWKNHLDSWAATGLSPAQSVASTFGAASAYAGIGSASLLDALNFGGGPGVDGAARNLLRAAVAALLNASHPGVSYPGVASGIYAGVDSALAGGDRDSMLALASSLDFDNNSGCPLN